MFQLNEIDQGRELFLARARALLSVYHLAGDGIEEGERKANGVEEKVNETRLDGDVGGFVRPSLLILSLASIPFLLSFFSFSTHGSMAYVLFIFTFQSIPRNKVVFLRHLRLITYSSLVTRIRSRGRRKSGDDDDGKGRH